MCVLRGGAGRYDCFGFLVFDSVPGECGVAGDAVAAKTLTISREAVSDNWTVTEPRLTDADHKFLCIICSARCWSSIIDDSPNAVTLTSCNRQYIAPRPQI